MVGVVARVDLKIKLATAAQRACVPQKERTCTTGVSDYVNTNTKCQNACPHGWKRPVLKLSEPRWGPCCRVGGARAAIRGCLHTGDSSRERVSLGHGAQAQGGRGVHEACAAGLHRTDGHEAHRGSRLSVARAHGPERRQLPGLP